MNWLLMIVPPVVLSIWLRIRYKFQSILYRRSAGYNKIEIAEVIAKKIED